MNKKPRDISHLLDENTKAFYLSNIYVNKYVQINSQLSEYASKISSYLDHLNFTFFNQIKSITAIKTNSSFLNKLFNRHKFVASLTTSNFDERAIEVSET